MPDPLVSPITADPAATGLWPADDGHMWIDRSFQNRLCQAGLSDFDAMLGTSRGRCMRALKDRENWYLPFANTERSTYGTYLKKHHVRNWATVLSARLGVGPGQTAGRVEAQNVSAISADGIAVMRLLAYGEKLHRNGLLESFVLTEELAGYLELNHFLRRHFPQRPVGRSRRRDHRLDLLIRRVAETARRFHNAGYNHRDFYCCHFFVKSRDDGDFDIKLIDLQRVQRRRYFRRRWLVKDLAQLAWSAPLDRLQCTHRMAFIRHYFGVRKLTAAQKRLIRQIVAKQQSMRRRLGDGQ